MRLRGQVELWLHFPSVPQCWGHLRLHPCKFVHFWCGGHIWVAAPWHEGGTVEVSTAMMQTINVSGMQVDAYITECICIICKYIMYIYIYDINVPLLGHLHFASHLMISSMWLNTTGSLVDWECVASSSARITGLCGKITIHTAGITFAAHCLLGAQWIRIFICFGMVRCHGSRTDVLPPRCVYSATVQPFSRASGSQILAESFWVIGGGMPRHGFPNKEDDTSQRSPAWKPYLYKGKSKLTLCHGLYFSVMLLQVSWTSAGLTPKRSFIFGISRTGSKYPEMAVLDLGFWMITDDDITSRMKGYAMPLCTATWYMHLKIPNHSKSIY